MKGGLLFLSREEAEAQLQEALEDTNGDDGDDEVGEGDDKGEWGDHGGDKLGEEGVGDGGDKWGEKEGNTGGEKGGAERKDATRQPRTTQEPVCRDSRKEGVGPGG